MLDCCEEKDEIPKELGCCCCDDDDNDDNDAVADCSARDGVIAISSIAYDSLAISVDVTFW